MEIGENAQGRHAEYSVADTKYTEGIRNNKNNSDLDMTLGIIKTGKKGEYLISLEKCLIYLIRKHNIRMNDTYTETTQYLKLYMHCLTVPYVSPCVCVHRKYIYMTNKAPWNCHSSHTQHPQKVKHNCTTIQNTTD